MMPKNIDLQNIKLGLDLLDLEEKSTRPRNKILNCNFSYECTKYWSTLAPTSDSKIKFCSDCDKTVHFCASEEELQRARQLNLCVAIKSVKRRKLNPFLMGQIVSDGQMEKNNEPGPKPKRYISARKASIFWWTVIPLILCITAWIKWA